MDSNHLGGLQPTDSPKSVYLKLAARLLLIVKYLPSYSPELNLIEILWRFIKYYWLPFSAYTSFQCLCTAVEDILTRFGTDYKITFQAA